MTKGDRFKRQGLNVGAIAASMIAIGLSSLVPGIIALRDGKTASFYGTSDVSPWYPLVFGAVFVCVGVAGAVKIYTDGGRGAEYEDLDPPLDLSELNRATAVLIVGFTAVVMALLILYLVTFPTPLDPAEARLQSYYPPPTCSPWCWQVICLSVLPIGLALWGFGTVWFLRVRRELKERIRVPAAGSS